MPFLPSPGLSGQGDVMNSQQWGALAERAARVGSTTLRDSFIWHERQEQAAEALASWGAKPSVCAAARTMPWAGKCGSWTWYRQEDGEYTVASNRRCRGATHAEETFQARRALNQAREAVYAALMTEAAEAVKGGAVLPWVDGNSGGVFLLLPLGGFGNERRVSAKGLAKRLGVPAPVCEGPHGYSYYGQASWEERLAAASEAFTEAVVGPEIPDATPEWPDSRARAAARARRNAPRSKSRVDHKRARESHHLPTWRWLVTAAA